MVYKRIYRKERRGRKEGEIGGDDIGGDLLFPLTLACWTPKQIPVIFPLSAFRHV
jgi:hypothetical protein